MENIKIPKFSGNILDYPDFQANFKALTSDEGYKEEVLLIYLKDALPQSAHYLLVGVKSSAAAWSRLDNKFGNKQQRIIAIHERLLKTELKGKDYEKLEKLHYNMELAQGLLEENDAVNTLNADRRASTMLLNSRDLVADTTFQIEESLKDMR